METLELSTKMRLQLEKKDGTWNQQILGVDHQQMVITPEIGSINYENVTRYSEDGDFIHVVLFDRLNDCFCPALRN